MSLASKGKRFVNFIIDYCIYNFIVEILFTYLLISFVEIYQDFVFSNNLDNSIIVIFSLILNYVFFVFYMSFQEYFLKGRTFAKYITGTKVVKEDGLEPQMKDYLIRSLCRLIPFEAFSFLGNIGWHDSISKTRVVNFSDFMFHKISSSEINEIGVKSHD